MVYRSYINKRSKMTYHVEQTIEAFGGKQKLLDLIFSEGITQIELHKVLGLSNSDKRLGAQVYKRIYNYLNINSLPYPQLEKRDRKFHLQLDKSLPNYWENNFIILELLNRLSNPTINIAEGRERYVISFPKHPTAIKTNQIKAHNIVWEINNSQYVPDNHWVIPIDGNYLNISKDNLRLVNTTEYKSKRFTGENNPSYIHGERCRPKLGG
jgi:hypothetical protein